MQKNSLFPNTFKKFLCWAKYISNKDPYNSSPMEIAISFQLQNEICKSFMDECESCTSEDVAYDAIGEVIENITNSSNEEDIIEITEPLIEALLRQAAEIIKLNRIN